MAPCKSAFERRSHAARETQRMGVNAMIRRLIARLRKPKPEQSALELEYRKRGLPVPPLNVRYLAVHVRTTMERV